MELLCSLILLISLGLFQSENLSRRYANHCIICHSVGMCGWCEKCEPYHHRETWCTVFYVTCRDGPTYDVNCTCHDCCPDYRWGLSCQYTCPNGCVHCDQRDGNICYDICSLNCIDRKCNNDSGHCLHGCVDKMFYGHTCSVKCNPNCKLGKCSSTEKCLHGWKYANYDVNVEDEQMEQP